MIVLPKIFLATFFVLCVHLSQHLTSAREEPWSRLTLKRNIARGVNQFLRKIKLPTVTTSLKHPVCSRTFPAEVKNKATELRSFLLNTQQNQTCNSGNHPLETLSTHGTNRKQQDHRERKEKRSIPPGCIDSMTYDEKAAREDLHPSVIIVDHICVKQEGDCDMKGSIDQNTQTVNMCHSCKFIVYLPSK